MQTNAWIYKPNQKLVETRESEVTPEYKRMKNKNNFKAIEADYNNLSLFLNF